MDTSNSYILQHMGDIINGLLSIAVLLFIIISAWFWRWIQQAKRIKLLQQGQIDLLAQIAAANGVSKDKIADIVAEIKVQTN